MKKIISLVVVSMLMLNLSCFISYAADSDTLTLKATIRDFKAEHPDFENSKFTNTHVENAVESTLGADGTPVYSAAKGSSIITSKESFNDWYHDTANNINIPYDMVFKKAADGKYVFDYTDVDFFPIDGKQGFGNYSNTKHNYHFTLELHTKFIYEPGLVFELAGDDDLWLFINKQLVADMGGVHETQKKSTTLDDYVDTMNLKTGDICTLDLFFAERQTTESNLKISTNMKLVSAAPVANAGEDQKVSSLGKSTSVNLDGSKSYDPNGEKLTYEWTNSDGEVISNDVKPKVELPDGINTITLTVDNGMHKDTDVVEITVKTNTPPKANAGDDQKKSSTGAKATVTLNGSKSNDPDGDILTYKWTENDKEIATGVTPKVDLPIGKHTITLTVSDGAQTSTDSVSIEVIDNNNNKPVANAGEDQKQTATASKTKITLDGSKSSDADGDTLTYKWTDADGKELATGQKPSIELPAGTNEIDLTVSDGHLTATDRVIITVTLSVPTPSGSSSGSSSSGSSGSSGSSSPTSTPANKKPVADAGSDRIVQTGEDSVKVVFDGSKSYDPDEDSLTYTWTNESGKLVGEGSKPSISLPVGKNTLTLTVSDGKLTDTDMVIVTIAKEEIPASVVEDLGIVLTADQVKVEEGNEIQFTMKYLNKTKSKVPDVQVSFDISEGMKVIDAAKGTVSKNAISWEIGDLASNKGGEITFTVQTDKIDTAEIVRNVVASIGSSAVTLTNTYDDESKLGVMVYSNEYDANHTRYILGYPDNTFKGDRNITRAETAVIFARILELQDLKVKNTNQFVDVAEGFWAEAHIYAAVEAGLFKGVDSTHFNPDVPITRAEFATVIANYLKLSRASEEKPFDETFIDIENHWAQGNIEEIARYKIVKGYSDGSFKPQKQILRQEAVTMINRMLYRGPLKGVTPSFPDVASDHWAFGEVEEAVRSHEYTMDEDGFENMTKFIDDPIW